MGLVYVLILFGIRRHIGDFTDIDEVLDTKFKLQSLLRDSCISDGESYFSYLDEADGLHIS